MDKQDPAELDIAYKKAYNAAGKNQRRILMKSHHLTDQIRAAERDKNKSLLIQLIREQMRLFEKLAGMEEDEA